MFASLIAARMLGPSEFGIWSAILLVFSYAYFSELGVGLAMGRQIPYLKSKGREGEIPGVIDTGFTVLLATSLLAALAIFIGTYFFFSESIVSYLRPATAVFVAIQIYIFCRSVCRGEAKFVIQSKAEVILGASYLLLVAIFTRRFGVYSLLLAMLTANMVAIAYILKAARIRLNLKLRRKYLKLVLGMGIQFFFISIVQCVYLTTDKLLAGRFFPVREFGIYNMAFMFSIFLNLFSQAMHESFIPYTTMRYAATGDKEGVRAYLLSLLRMLNLFLPVLIGLVCISVGPAIKYFLPGYIQAVSITKIVIFANFFYLTFNMSVQYFTAIGRPVKWIPYMLCGILFNLVLGYTFIKMGLGIQWLAISVLVTSAFISLLLMLRVFIDYRRGALQAGLLLARIYWPLIYALAAYFLARKLPGFFLQAGVFLLLAMPLLLVVFRLKREFSLTYQRIDSNVWDMRQD